MSEINKTNKKDVLSLLTITIIACVLYLFNINFSDIWVDEVFTRELIRKPLDNLFKLLTDDFHPPLYFLGLKMFTSVVGLTDFSIRLFSTIGALLTLLLSYMVGKKVLKTNGAFYFSFILLALPMLASNAQTARMYTWAVFFTTGVFFYACLFIQSGKKKDLILLGIFSLMALYTHYYCIIAAFWANVFVFAFLLIRKKTYWKSHLIMSLLLVVLFLPWLFTLFKHLGAANEEFWIPPPSFTTFFQCYSIPFAKKFTLITSSYILLSIIYMTTILSIYVTFKTTKKGDLSRIALGLSMTIYNATILTALIISLFSQSILYFRYVMTMASMLYIPVAIFLVSINNQWIKYGLLALIFSLGIYTSVKASYFSYGPYNQAISHFEDSHPEIDKIIYQSEVSLAPLLYYSKNENIKHYWLDNDSSIYFTNLKVFDELQFVNSLNEMLHPGDTFCFAGIRRVPLNLENAKMIFSKSKFISADTIIDKKDSTSMQIILNYLEFATPDTMSEND
jgi:uncharacterized membrane protein